MQYTINQLRQTIFKPVYDIYTVFQNFFGERFTDLQNLPDDSNLKNTVFLITDNFPSDAPIELSDQDIEYLIVRYNIYQASILVWWPEVKVTNEYDKYVYIQDLYAKIVLNRDGTIPLEQPGFKLNRATYDKLQWKSNYMHSHIPKIPKENLESFQTPCMGTGPIKEVINSLKAHINEGFNELQWMLFCQELSQYVQVESIRGVPYKHLENIGGTTHIHTNITPQIIKNLFPDNVTRCIADFIRFYLQHNHLSFNFENGKFVLGMPVFDYIIDVSNSFIEYANQHFTSHNVDEFFNAKALYHCVAADGKFYQTDTLLPIDTTFIGKKVCKFKGHDITLNIIDNVSEVQESTILDPKIGMYIITKILNTINYHYGNQEDQSTSSHQAVCYL